MAGASVLEVGAGIGDHSHYYIDRGCNITITEARPENIRYLRARYPGRDIRTLDMENPSPIAGSPFDVVHCYGLLYHLSKPEQALAFLAENTRSLLLLETCVSFGDDDSINLVQEPKLSLTQAISGIGCRPTRPYLFRRLSTLFEHVYLPKTQPNHGEFPLDWTAPENHSAKLQRAVFIASRKPLNHPELLSSVPAIQSRHE